MSSFKENMFGYILIGFVVMFCLKIYSESDAYNLKCIESSVDGNTYCVRETPKLELVANLLATVTVKLKKLVKHMEKKYPKRENVKRLVNGFNPKKINETLPTSQFTAYSENKGEKLAFCTTTTKRGTKLIDENTLTFVGIHEISHIMTKSIGHKQEFWRNFKFLLQNAKQIGIYQPIDYKKKPKEYCGMDITDNPYYDY
uniref:WLM domain-containing protein n=1 Tax=viral metagenome TaxID=1070528 RepID=A0A6C0AK09_9ZZZZ